MSKRKPVNVTMPENLRDLADAYAEETGRTLSAFLEDILREYLEAKGYPVGPELEAVIKRLEVRKAAPKKPPQTGGTVEL